MAAMHGQCMVWEQICPPGLERHHWNWVAMWRYCEAMAGHHFQCIQVWLVLLAKGLTNLPTQPASHKSSQISNNANASWWRPDTCQNFSAPFSLNNGRGWEQILCTMLSEFGLLALASKPFQTHGWRMLGDVGGRSSWWCCGSADGILVLAALWWLMHWGYGLHLRHGTSCNGLRLLIYRLATYYRR